VIADLVSDFVTWMEALPPLWAYCIVLVIAYGENVVPPIPGDLIVVFGGYLAGLGQLHLGVVVLLSTIGGALGFMSMYAIGYRLGEAVLDPDRLRWIPQEQIDKAQRWIQRWGYGVVAANRFLSGARSVISLTVGMARMSPGWTAWWCTVSAAVWTALIAYAGYAVGENWRVVVEYLRLYGRFVLAVLFLIALGLLIRAYWRRQPPKDEAPVRKNDGDA
jgi:membrane protein DedA with SNARE-associated domain